MSLGRWSLGGVLSLVLLSACPPKVNPPIVMPADSLGDTTVGVAYSRTLTATRGLVSGPPAAPGPSGPRVFRAVAANGPAATATFSFTIQAQLTLTATLPSTANVGTPYNGLLTASGGLPPVTFGVASGQF